MTDSRLNSAIEVAIHNDNKEEFDRLMTQIAAPRSFVFKKYTAKGAVYAKNPYYLLALLKAGLDPNMTVSDYPLLHLALADTIKLNALIEAGANVGAVDAKKRTALQLAIDGNIFVEAAQILIAHGAPDVSRIMKEALETWKHDKDEKGKILALARAHGVE